jgi:hypothetical protein
MTSPACDAFNPKTPVMAYTSRNHVVVVSLWPSSHVR